MEAALQEKEEAIKLLEKLNSKYKEYDIIWNQEVIDLQEKLANTSKTAGDIKIRNQELLKELNISKKILNSTQDLTIKSVAKFESKIESQNEKINCQAKEIENLKKQLVDKIKKQLLAAKKEVKHAKETV